MRLSRFAGCRYLHSPFPSIAHNVGSAEDWAQRWERFLNLGDEEATVPKNAELVPLADVLRDPEAYAGRPVVVASTQFHLPLRGVTHLQNALQPVLRARYRRAGKAHVPMHHGPTGSINVAIHLRRGDVSETRNPNRYVADEQILRSIARLRTAAAPFGRPLHINLYSEGTAGQFQAFADAGCGLHISEDPFETLHNMIVADILLLGRGNFSQLAGVLSEGIVISPPRAWNDPSHLWSGQLPERWSNWLNRRKNGELPIGPLRRALLARAGWLEKCAYRMRRLRERWTAA